MQTAAGVTWYDPVGEVVCSVVSCVDSSPNSATFYRCDFNIFIFLLSRDSSVADFIIFVILLTCREFCFVFVCFDELSLTSASLLLNRKNLRFLRAGALPTTMSPGG